MSALPHHPPFSIQSCAFCNELVVVKFLVFCGWLIGFFGRWTICFHSPIVVICPGKEWCRLVSLLHKSLKFFITEWFCVRSPCCEHEPASQAYSDQEKKAMLFCD